MSRPSVLPPKQLKERPSRLPSLPFLAMFCVLAALFALGQFHRSSGGVLSTTFATEFSFGPSELGMVIGSLFLGQALGQIPAGVILDRCGARWTIPSMSLIAVLGCFVIAAATGWFALLIGRMMIGFGFAAVMVGSIWVLTRWVPPRSLSTVTGRLLFLGMLGGIFATSPFAAVIERYGWRSAYVGLGLLTILAAAITAMVARDRPAGERKLPAGRPETLRSCLAGFGMVLRTRRLWPILIVAPTLYSPGQVLLGLWLAPYLKDVHDIDAITRGYALAAMVVAMSVGVLVYGPIEQHLKARRPVVVSGALCTSASFVGLAVAGGWSPIAAAGFSVAAMLSSTFFIVVLAHAQSLFPSGYAGRVVSVLGLLAISGIFCAQMLTALLLTAFPGPPGTTATELGYQLMFAGMAAVFIAVAWCYRTVDEPTHQ